MGGMSFAFTVIHKNVVFCPPPAKVWDQKPSSSGTGGTAITPAVIQSDAVTMETWHRDFRPEQTRSDSPSLLALPSIHRIHVAASVLTIRLG
ncbi:hypothetical protein ATANTOWER_021519 [Ataeniobius toweri]|uniref:Uncharacterized protein n=1 Tax=Ataeniobius toweri TaxID=208326 RepID=A0ABU7CCE7_9TELE|nr:hypothetical protein [Ataeniobius toweri]